MADSDTDFLEATKPEVGASEDSWGDKLNADLDNFDGAFQTIVEAYNYAVATGVDTITVTLDLPPSAYVDGFNVRFKTAGANTTGPTLNVNGLGAKPIKYNDGSSIPAGGLASGVIYAADYDGTQFVLAPSTGPASAAEIIAGTVAGKYVSPAIWASLMSWANPGYFKLPGGVIQWGSATVGTDSSLDVTLPVTMTGSNGVVVPGYGGSITPISGTAILGVQARFLNGAQIRLSNDNVSATVYWIAVGPV